MACGTSAHVQLSWSARTLTQVRKVIVGQVAGCVAVDWPQQCEQVYIAVLVERQVVQHVPHRVVVMRLVVSATITLWVVGCIICLALAAATVRAVVVTANIVVAVVTIIVLLGLGLALLVVDTLVWSGRHLVRPSASWQAASCSHTTGSLVLQHVTEALAGGGGDEVELSQPPRGATWAGLLMATPPPPLPSHSGSGKAGGISTKFVAVISKADSVGRPRIAAVTRSTKGPAKEAGDLTVVTVALYTRPQSSVSLTMYKRCFGAAIIMP